MKDGKRKGEAAGRRLTLGERAINWAKAGAIIVPLLGAGAIGGNLPAVKTYLPDFTGEVETPIAGDIHPEVRQKMERMIALLNEHTERFERIEARSEQGDSAITARLQLQIDANKRRINDWHD